VTPSQLAQVAAIAIALVAAVAVSFLLTPLAMRFSRRFGVMDNPDSARRVHRAPIPRAGGWAIAIAFVSVGAVSLVVLRLSDSLEFQGHHIRELIALMAGTLAAASIGFIDDRWQIRARWQFIGQLALSLIPVVAATSITVIYNPFAGAGQSSTQLLAEPLPQILTVLWVIGMLNSINFIDGLDGLSSGIALIAAVTLGILAFQQGQPTVSLLCGVLAGALGGFLPWNFHPAKVFSGTTGVLAVGFALAVLSVLGTAKIAVALLVLGVPIIDTFWIIIRRISHGRSPFTPDRGHLHHRLLDLGLTHRGVVLLIYAMCCALAVLSFYISQRDQLYAFAGFIVGGGVLLFMLTRRGHSDALEADSYPDDVNPSDPPTDAQLRFSDPDARRVGVARIAPDER
jgi:UDP-GlcNAc:undecaprenyl-phosphate GlcNAc-1-phosphate transferase